MTAARRLAAIRVADDTVSSQLMGADESAPADKLAQLRLQVVELVRNSAAPSSSAGAVARRRGDLGNRLLISRNSASPTMPGTLISDRITISGWSI